MRESPPPADDLPRLRPLDIRWVQEGGIRFLLLRDPLGVSPRTLMVPGDLAPVLALCDGTRDIPALLTGLRLRTGLMVSPSRLEELLRLLDEALFLDNGRFRSAARQALQDYRSAPHRRPALAGQVYPTDPGELRDALERFCQSARGTSPPPGGGTLRGLLTPHIDYARGGPVYAGVWQAVAPDLGAFRRVVLLGTDHAGRPGALTLTRQNYASPLGALPTDGEAVEALARAIGPEEAFADELHHLGEHSVELALVWLQFALGGREVRVVPVLCGPMPGPDGGPYEPFISALRALLEEGPTLVVAAGDLAHMGPAFGDPLPLDPLGRARLSSADRHTLELVSQGDAEAFLADVWGDGDARRYCGLTPIYLALRAMGPVRGHLTGYAQCPADAEGGSVVSVAGMAFFQG